MLHIASVERDTGISKDVLRKWEGRYGFPVPVRMPDGDRYYPPEQVERLRLIKRLLDAGFRPGRVVPAEDDELGQLSAELNQGGGKRPESGFIETSIQALESYDITTLDSLLRAKLGKQGLGAFVLEDMAPLACAVGDAWASGRLQVHHEHAFTEVAKALLHSSISNLGQPIERAPRVVLATPSGELHTLGILMAQAILTLHGANVLQLGQQVPFNDIVGAVSRHRADLVGLSFSPCYSARLGKALLQELRQALDPGVEIWAGGLAVRRFARMPSGVTAVTDLDKAAELLEGLRARIAAEG